MNDIRRLDRGRPTQQIDGFYDDFAICPSGTFGHPLVDPGEREPSEGWFEKAREAFSFGSNSRFEMIARRIDQIFRW